MRLRILATLIFVLMATGASAKDCPEGKKCMFTGGQTVPLKFLEGMVLSDTGMSFGELNPDVNVIVIKKERYIAPNQHVVIGVSEPERPNGVFSTCEPEQNLMGCTEALENIFLKELAELSGKEMEFYIERNDWQIDGPLHQVVIPKGTKFWVL